MDFGCLNDHKESEKGNVWLVDESGAHNAWIRLDHEGTWLEISIRCENYPGLTVAVIDNLTDAELLEHILRECKGMYIRKLCLDGAEHYKDGSMI